MSAALQLNGIMAAAASLHAVRRVSRRDEESQVEPVPASPLEDDKQPLRTLAFYRKHTESLLRRYLYASMLVGRTPLMLEHSMGRGRASSRPVRTFEEAVNFVIDVEASLAQLNALDRCLLNRVVLQEYTVAEAAVILRIGVNTVVRRLGVATDRLTEILLRQDLLAIPH